MDGEEWQGLTVRACNGRVVGVVVGVFAEGPLSGRLRVHGEFTSRRHPAWLWDGTLVFAIPRQAVVHRTRHSLVLDVPLAAARARWLVQVMQREGAQPPAARDARLLPLLNNRAAWTSAAPSAPESRPAVAEP